VGEASAYELTKAMRRNLRFFWPRAEARIYAEAKRLAEAGLASATRGRTGRRPRTVYAITNAGRRELGAWLGTPPEPVSLEHGPLLRVFLGREGTPAELRDAIAAARDQAEAMLAVGTPLGHEYLERRHPQQGEVHLRALTFDYLYGGRSSRGSGRTAPPPRWPAGTTRAPAMPRSGARWHASAAACASASDATRTRRSGS
jgi:PadR family transcriptional regulator, regulatory protein AphA